MQTFGIGFLAKQTKQGVVMKLIIVGEIVIKSPYEPCAVDASQARGSGRPDRRRAHMAATWIARNANKKPTVVFILCKNVRKLYSLHLTRFTTTG